MYNLSISIFVNKNISVHVDIKKEIVPQ